jgi:diguanylate cyclase (GGDEF)-like protein
MFFRQMNSREEGSGLGDKIQMEDPDQKPESHRKTHRVSLRWMLTVPFILQVTFIVGWVGYMTHRNGQRSIEDLTQQLMQSVSSQVDQKLVTYLDTPILANHYHRDAVKQGILSMDLSKRDPQREQYLWKQMRLFPNFTWISLGSAKGDAIGVWRPEKDAALQMSLSNASTQYLGNYYATETPGTLTKPLKIESPAFDPRTRPWYKAAIEAQETVWSPIYTGFTPGTIFIASNQPLYDVNNQLVGVSGIDISLSEIQNFLSKIDVPGQIFIMERSGLLISSSNREQPSQMVNGKSERLRAINSKTPIIRETTRSILNKVQTFERLQKNRSFYFQDPASGKSAGKFVSVVPFSHGKGLDWFIVIVVPELEVMAKVEAGNQVTLAFCLIALLVVILLNMIISNKLTEPILQLSEASKEMTEGNFQSRLRMPRILELSNLTFYFNQMSQEIQQSRQELADHARSLEQKVADRTHDLQEEIDRRGQAESALKLANYKLERLAYLDGLTQISNRRSFDERFLQEWKRARRNKTALSIVLCDVDYFKKYNDTYGHILGDECLCTIAQALASVVCRPSDCVARYGGEEFVILLPDTDTTGAIKVAEAMRSKVHSLEITHDASEVSEFVTLSFGVASLIPTGTIPREALLNRADRALYQAKQAGRDQVSL